MTVACGFHRQYKSVSHLHALIKAGIDGVKILAVQLLLRDAEGIGKIILSNKTRILCLIGKFVVLDIFDKGLEAL